MIRTYIYLLILTLALLIGCTESSTYSDEQVRAEIQNVFDDFYTKYESEDISFTDYYTDDVIRLAPTGEFTDSVHEFREGWKQTIQDDSFELLDFGEPRFVISPEQVVSFNTFDEIFIAPETGDTTRYTGTWVAVWQKQESGEWKIRMTTWHSDSQ